MYFYKNVYNTFTKIKTENIFQFLFYFLFIILFIMDPLLILLFLVLFLLSAFFSWTELALMSLPKHKIDSLIKQNKFGSKALKKIKENNDRLLITILIWNNLVNTFTAALATSISIQIARSWWLWLDESTAIGLSTWLVTFLLLLFWEIIPKSIATKNASSISLAVAPIYKFLMFILYPVISFMEILIKLFSGKKKVEQITEEEVESFIDMWKDSWWIDEHEHEKIKSILEFDETEVSEIMTPRVKIEAISDNITVNDAMEFYLSHTHSRIPVYHETIDKIDYFISSRDLIKEFHLWNLDKKIKDLKLKEVLKVPLNQSIAKLMETFQKAHKIMAIIIDEYGGVSGLITMEDIIEEVFWEIRDETDKEAEEFVKIWKDSIRVESDVLIENVLEKFKLELEDIGLDEKEFDWENLSYVITHKLERFPSTWEIISFDIKSEQEKEIKQRVLSLKVLSIDNAKIGKVDIRVLDKEKTA